MEGSDYLFQLQDGRRSSDTTPSSLQLGVEVLRVSEGAAGKRRGFEVAAAGSPSLLASGSAGLQVIAWAPRLLRTPGTSPVSSALPCRHRPIALAPSTSGPWHCAEPGGHSCHHPASRSSTRLDGSGRAREGIAGDHHHHRQPGGRLVLALVDGSDDVGERQIALTDLARLIGGARDWI